MRALVVYESMYGNTHVIASNIADGLRSTCEVTLVPVAEATWDLIADADLLVAGTHDARRGEQDVPARAGLRIAKAR
jgi:flavodoxin